MPKLLQSMIAINKQPTNRFQFNGQFGKFLAYAGMFIFSILLIADIGSSTRALWGWIFDPFQIDSHGQHPAVYTGIGVGVSIFLAMGATIGYFYTFFSHGSGYYQEKQAQETNEAIHQHDAMTDSGLVRGFIYWILHIFDDLATLCTFLFLITTNTSGLWQFQGPHGSIGSLTWIGFVDLSCSIIWDYLATQGLIRAFHVLEDSLAKIRRSERFIMSIPAYNLQEVENDPIVIPAEEEVPVIPQRKKQEAVSGVFRQESSRTGMEDLPQKPRRRNTEEAEA